MKWNERNLLYVYTSCFSSYKCHFLVCLGTVSSVIACPLDVVKTRVQGRRLEAPKESTGKILSNIVKNEGPRYLFKGLLPRLVAVPSMMSLFYMLNVKFNEYFLH